MTTSRATTDIADEILEILEGRKRERTVEAAAVEAAKEPVPEEVTTLTTTPWANRDDGRTMRLVPFSEMFWTPKYVPDHLVPEFKGYNSAIKPEPYIPPVQEFETLSLSISLGLKVNVVGPTGAGKTLMYEYYAASTGRPYLRIEHNMELDKASIFGQVHINVDDDGKQSTDFVMGVLPKSLAEPTLCNLDELSRASGFANVMYQRLLDRRELALPELKSGGTLKPDDFWVVCASDNTKGNGEDMDLYSASNVQDASFINRWDIVIEQDYLTQEQEIRLLAGISRTITPTEAERLAKFSYLCHAGFKKGDIATAFSPRNLTAIAKLVDAGVTVKDAIRMNYTTRCSKSEQSAVQEFVAAAFGR